MNEFIEIIKAYDEAKSRGQSSVLATVVHLEGSSYRRPGARMLILDDGFLIGAISGGCLEGDALKKALLTFSEKKSRLVTYDTSDEDDASIGVQLGCEGVIQVLFEFIDAEDKLNPVELLRKAISERRVAVLVTLFDLTHKKNEQPGTSYLQEYSKKAISRIKSDVLNALISAEVDRSMASAKSVLVSFADQQHSLNAFIEFIEPPIAIVVIGAGNDAIPLMQIATILGWEVKVADGRKTHAKRERFINACQVLVSKPEKVLEQISIDNRTCFVLLTHNYRYDLQMLKALLVTDVPYIGVLGPKKKLNKMLDEIQDEGMNITDQMLSRVYGPTGLDIGAETSGEIAASIIAEIQAVFNKKNGQMLKLKKDHIHS